MNQSKTQPRIVLFKKRPTLWAALFLLSIQAFAIEQALPYQNPERSAEQRVDDLLARMTLREKAGQMSQYVGIEHIKKSKKSISEKNLMNSDQKGFYPGLSIEEVVERIEKGEIGSFLHVVILSSMPLASASDVMGATISSTSELRENSVGSSFSAPASILDISRKSLIILARRSMLSSAILSDW